MLISMSLDAPFGVEIGDFSATTNDQATMKALLEAFYENQFIVIPRQELDVGQFNAFCSWFGTPEPHFLDHLRLPGYPAVLTLSNMTKDGRQIGVHEGASFWHTDVAYRVPPNSTTITFSVVAPAKPVELEIANMVQAYEDLPASVKREIDGLRVLHHYGNRADMDEKSPYSAETLTEEQKKRVTNVYQPLVVKHPITGQKALYAVAGSSFGIKGMKDEVALSLLDELKEHAIQTKFVRRYPYKQGDIVAWDTLATMHKGPLTRLTNDQRESRLLWRISVTGHNPMCLQTGVFPSSPN